MLKLVGKSSTAWARRGRVALRALSTPPPGGGNFLKSYKFIGYGWGGVAIAGIIAYSTTFLDKRWFPEDSESKPAAADPH